MMMKRSPMPQPRPIASLYLYNTTDVVHVRNISVWCGNGSIGTHAELVKRLITAQLIVDTGIPIIIVPMMIVH